MLLMNAQDILTEAHKGLKELEKAREEALKHAAIAMLDATLPLEIKGGYFLDRTTKEAKLQTEKLTVTMAYQKSKPTIDAGLKGKTQKSADQALAKLTKQNNYEQGVESIK